MHLTSVYDDVRREVQDLIAELEYVVGELEDKRMDHAADELINQSSTIAGIIGRYLLEDIL